MIKSIVFSLVLFSSCTYADFKSDLVGEWNAFGSNYEFNYYMYLNINSDFTGTFATTKDGVFRILDFAKEQVNVSNGHLNITLRESDKLKTVLVISAFTTTSTSLLTGNLFLYSKSSNGSVKLFNTISIRMLPIKSMKLLSDIKDLHKQL